MAYFDDWTFAVSQPTPDRTLYTASRAGDHAANFKADSEADLASVLAAYELPYVNAAVAELAAEDARLTEEARVANEMGLSAASLLDA